MTSQPTEHVHAFRIHAVMFAIGMVIVFLVNLLTNLATGIAGNWSAWWSVWALMGWSAGLTVHGMVVWLEQSGTASSSERSDEGTDKEHQPAG